MNISRKEAKRIFKLKLESAMWSLKHPILAFINYAPRTKVFDKFITKTFSESTIEKCFNCPTSYIPKWKLNTLTLLKSLLGGAKL